MYRKTCCDSNATRKYKVSHLTKIYGSYRAFFVIWSANRVEGKRVKKDSKRGHTVQMWKSKDKLERGNQSFNENILFQKVSQHATKWGLPALCSCYA